jgi:alkylation response protein AidB-like acyl-CoA dehydrogenase
METPAIAPEILYARAREIGVRIAALAEQTERDRRVSAEATAWLRDAGLYRILLPQRLGGLEYPPSVFARVVIELSRGCGATGWVYAVTALQQFLVATFPLAAQHDVFGSSAQPVIAAAFAPAGELTRASGGYRLSARWTYVSGCDVAEWLFASVMLPAAGSERPARAFLLVPRCDFEIVDTWYAAALSGTGSKDVAVHDVFVPDHRVNVLDSAAAVPGEETNSMYHLPYQSVVPVALVSPVLGMLEDALESFVAIAKGKMTRVSSTGATASMADMTVVQFRIGEGYSLLDAGKRIIFGNLEEMVAAAALDAGISTEMRLKWRTDYAFVAHLCTQAVDGLFHCLGASGLALDNRVQRAWRDINGAGRHIGLNWDSYSAMYGQFKLGGTPRGQY